MNEMNQAGMRKRFWTGGRLTLTAFVFAVALVVASSCTSNDTANLTANGGAQANRPTVTITSSRGPAPPNQNAARDTLAPELMNTEIQSLDGKTFRLADYNDKVLVLDIWATWCGPCRMEIPHLVNLSKEYAPKGVEVVGLTTESPQSDYEQVKQFVEDYDINYRIGWARADLALGLMRGNSSIPQTFVIAPGGRVVGHYRGYSNQLPDMIRATLDKATDRTNGD